MKNITLNFNTTEVKQKGLMAASNKFCHKTTLMFQ